MERDGRYYSQAGEERAVDLQAFKIRRSQWREMADSDAPLPKAGVCKVSGQTIERPLTFSPSWPAGTYRFHVRVWCGLTSRPERSFPLAAAFERELRLT